MRPSPWLILAVAVVGLANAIVAMSAPAAATDEAARNARLAERDRLADASNDFRIDGKFADARELEAKALGIERELFGPDHDEIAARFVTLAELELQAGQAKAARDWYRQAHEMYVRLHTDEYYRAVRTKRYLAHAEAVARQAARQ